MNLTLLHVRHLQETMKIHFLFGKQLKYLCTYKCKNLPRWRPEKLQVHWSKWSELEHHSYLQKWYLWQNLFHLFLSDLTQVPDKAFNTKYQLSVQTAVFLPKICQVWSYKKPPKRHKKTPALNWRLSTKKPHTNTRLFCFKAKTLKTSLLLCYFENNGTKPSRSKFIIQWGTIKNTAILPLSNSWTSGKVFSSTSLISKSDGKRHRPWYESACQRRKKKIASWLLFLISQPQADGVCEINAVQEEKSKECLLPACQSRASFQSAGCREQRTAGLCSRAWTSAQSFPYLPPPHSQQPVGRQFWKCEVKNKLNLIFLAQRSESLPGSKLNAWALVYSLRGTRETLLPAGLLQCLAAPQSFSHPHATCLSALLTSPKIGSESFQGKKKKIKTKTQVIWFPILAYFMPRLPEAAKQEEKQKQPGSGWGMRESISPPAAAGANTSHGQTTPWAQPTGISTSNIKAWNLQTVDNSICEAKTWLKS